MDRFWMVFVEGAGLPLYKHLNKEAAEREAAELASQTGHPAFLLQAVAVCNCGASIWTDLGEPEAQ